MLRAAVKAARRSVLRQKKVMDAGSSFRRHHHRSGEGTAEASGLQERLPVRRLSAHHPQAEAMRESGVDLDFVLEST